MPLWLWVTGIVYVGLGSFGPQHHELIKFRKENICSCHLGVFKQQGRLIGGRKSYFANAQEACLYYFESHIDVQFVTICRLMSDHFDKNFFCNE